MERLNCCKCEAILAEYEIARGRAASDYPDRIICERCEALRAVQAAVLNAATQAAHEACIGAIANEDESEVSIVRKVTWRAAKEAMKEVLRTTHADVDARLEKRAYRLAEEVSESVVERTLNH